MRYSPAFLLLYLWHAPLVSLPVGSAGLATYPIVRAHVLAGAPLPPATRLIFQGDTEPQPTLLTHDTLWTAAESPYRIQADLTVAAGTTLTITAGTTVLLAPDVQVIIQGRLSAQGQEQAPIWFTRSAESAAPWGGLQFRDTPADNILRYCVLEYGQHMDGMIGVENSTLHLDHITFDHTRLRRIRTIDSNLRVENCYFTDIFSPNEPPLTDNYSEHIWGGGVPAGGYFIVRDNVFGRTKGHNDAIDFDGPSRPNPIPQIMDNTFLGGGDDALDLETDAHIEGNLFLNFIKDKYNNASGESNVISAGDGRHYVMVRNIFKNVQHVAQVKDGSFLTFTNNTVYGASAPAIYFDLDLPGRHPGRGALIDGCIFAATPDPLAGVTDTTDLTIRHSLIQQTWHAYGTGNFEADPLFAGPDQNDFSLKADSIARGTGPWGLDMGAWVSAGAAITGEPTRTTHRTVAQLTVSGPGITHYRYALNNPLGPWGEATDVNKPLLLPGLLDGASYTVYVSGRNTASVWQQAPARSRTWTVDVATTSLLINEILAHSLQIFPEEDRLADFVELSYDGPAPLDLGGMSVSDSMSLPDKYVFPPGLKMHPDEYLVLWADAMETSPGIHLGFHLDHEGQGIYLFNRWGELIDAVDFGSQVPDHSIGRWGANGDWTLTTPTSGAANIRSALGDPAVLVINEWLTQGEVLLASDFIELYNRQAHPVRIGGLSLTAHPLGVHNSPRWPRWSFIAGGGYAVWQADGRADPGHVDFELPFDRGYIGLLDPHGQVMDEITYGPQNADVSEGRLPDGAAKIEAFDLPSPGRLNPGAVQFENTPVTFLTQADEKRAWIPTALHEVDETWRIDPDFEDTHWWVSSGAPGGVGYEDGSGYENLISLDVMAMHTQATSCYIRSPFQVTDAQADNVTALRLKIRYDDGFVAYLNGVEIARRNFTGDVHWDARASDNHEARIGDFDVDLDLPDFIHVLTPGRNVLAVQGLNVSETSSDFIISTQLEGTLTEIIPAQDFSRERDLLADLGLSEVMYHDVTGSDYEYIELVNRGDRTLDLTGVRFTQGIDFVFPMFNLAPRKTVVLAARPDAFLSLYGKVGEVLGPYQGELNNGGEELILELPWPMGLAILRFTYDDNWYPETDGQGKSLALADPGGPPNRLNLAESWFSSDPSPGRL